MIVSLRRLRWAACAVALAWFSSVCIAAEPWPTAGFKYYARQSSLLHVLSDFSSTFGISLAFSSDLDGKVSGDLSAPNPTAFLNSLASSYGFNWYYQAGVLHVSPARDWVTQVLHVGMTASDVSALRTELKGLGIFETRFGWAEFPGRGIVIVSGPEAYVSRISSVVGSLGTGPSDGRQLRVFRLQNARAEDYTFSYQGENVVTPGVATLLRRLAAGSIAQQAQNPSSGPLSVAPSVMEPAPLANPTSEDGDKTSASAALQAQTLPRSAPTSLLTQIAPPAARDNASSSNGKGAVNAGLNALTPVIEADPRLNSVIIYDAPEKMAIYEALIRELDAGTPQIQIEAMILDVDAEKLDTLGVSWRAGASHVSVGFDDGGGQGTLLAVNTNSFFARIRALVMKGDARVLGRPSILTLDNLSAVLSLSETVYARVSDSGGGRKNGNSGGLIPINTGTLLKVVPRLIDDNGRRDVSLAVEIQDGQIRHGVEDREDTLPTVRQSAIDTQAVVKESDSLVIGGYFMDSDSTEERRTPGLSSVPLLGALFRGKNGQHERSARLFIIRPTLVPTAGTAVPDLDPLAQPAPGPAPAPKK
jgi:type III secretion protein C